MQEDTDLDPIRDDPAFAEIMKAGHPDRRYAAVPGTTDARFEAMLDLRARSRRSPGKEVPGTDRPGLSPRVVVGRRRTASEGSPVTASVWHRPTVQRRGQRPTGRASGTSRDRPASDGQELEDVWQLLKHSADPRLAQLHRQLVEPPGRRSEADRWPSSTRPIGFTNAKPTPAQGQQRMDAMLFHPETSMRRALVLALGTFSLDGLSPGELETLIAKLLDLYRNDSDAGIHGAAEWTLRKWGQQAKLKELESELMKLKDRGERRWFVNSQGQTFAVIDGPVEFIMGSPATDPDHRDDETPKHMRIPRRFAIAAKEVTIEQFQRFLKLGGITIDRYQLSPSDLAMYSPDPDGPWIAPDWYTAAHYCNWLSEQDGLPKDQWCYLPNDSEAYAEGMSIPADVLERTGYRLLTEAEWEYACRAGTATSRYHGQSIELLEAYARYQANSKEHAWGCGSLFPNDLGLFDMLGNMFEWCQDRYGASQPRRKGLSNDILSISESVSEKFPRLLRGGAFVSQPASVRSAYRGWYAPASRNSNLGFRPSRTYH